MAYVKAVILAVLAAIALGAAGGAWALLKLTVERLRPEDKAAVYSQAISEAINCLAFYITVLIPFAVVLVAIRRRRRRLRGG